MSSSVTHPQVGAQVTPGGVTYTVWAPEHQAVAVIIKTDTKVSRRVELARMEATDYFSAVDAEGRAGDLYTYTLETEKGIPDFASRFQPQGVFGPSQVIDSSAYVWQNLDWKRPAWSGQIIYEVHLGTFTPEGTYRAAQEKLDVLVELGITAVEIMPVAEWAGGRNWGYDGVLLFSPTHRYGTPDDFRALIDACHARKLAVILDVVWNHLGPVANYSQQFSSHYFHRESRLWGNNFNLDAGHSEPVRQYLLQNIRAWVDDFRIDGFRMDATHAIRDASPVHILAEAAEMVHAAGGFMIAEDERNDAKIFRDKKAGGWKFDGVWADDFHHTARVNQTQEQDSFFASYKGTPEEIAETITHGWLYRGEKFPATGEGRGTECQELPPESFVYCISNHDQVGNRALGERLHQQISPQAYRALSLFFCLVPATPMLFMGQEWGASTPFLYFTDLPGEIGEKMGFYRCEEFKETFQNLDEKTINAIPNPQALSTFTRSQLTWEEITRPLHQQIFRLYQTALRFRKTLFGAKNPSRADYTVEHNAHSVTIHYRLQGKHFLLQFQPASQGERPLAEHRVLLRSNQNEFTPELVERGPETFLLEVNS